MAAAVAAGAAVAGAAVAGAAGAGAARQIFHRHDPKPTVCTWARKLERTGVEIQHLWYTDVPCVQRIDQLGLPNLIVRQITFSDLDRSPERLSDSRRWHRVIAGLWHAGDSERSGGKTVGLAKFKMDSLHRRLSVEWK